MRRPANGDAGEAAEAAGKDCITVRQPEPAGSALVQYQLRQVIDGGLRYVRSLPSPPDFHRRKKQCISDRQTRATDECQLP